MSRERLGINVDLCSETAFCFVYTDDITAPFSGFAGEDGVYPGCHHRPEEIWWPTPRDGLLRHAAWYWHRGKTLVRNTASVTDIF